jgi:hypothetical protein
MIISEIVGTIIRAFLVWLSAWLVAHGGHQLTDSQIGNAVACLGPVVVALVWSIWRKIVNRQHLLNALATPGVQSEKDNAAAVKYDGAPSVFTSPVDIPKPPTT